MSPLIGRTARVLIAVTALALTAIGPPGCATGDPQDPQDPREIVRQVILTAGEIGLDIHAVRIAPTPEAKAAAEAELLKDLKELAGKVPQQFSWAAEIVQIASDYERFRRISDDKWLAALQALMEWAKRPTAPEDIKAWREAKAVGG